MQPSIIVIDYRDREIGVSVYLPGPAVGLVVHSVDHTGGHARAMGVDRETVQCQVFLSHTGVSNSGPGVLQCRFRLKPRTNIPYSTD